MHPIHSAPRFIPTPPYSPLSQLPAPTAVSGPPKVVYSLLNDSAQNWFLIPLRRILRWNTEQRLPSRPPTPSSSPPRHVSLCPQAQLSKSKSCLDSPPPTPPPSGTVKLNRMANTVQTTQEPVQARAIHSGRHSHTLTRFLCATSRCS